MVQKLTKEEEYEITKELEQKLLK